MKSLLSVLGTVLILAGLLIGCASDQGSPTGPMLDDPMLKASGAAEALTVTSAVLWVYETNATGPATANVHNITSSWTEYGVTFGNFGDAYDPAIIGSFSATTFGWHSVDITSLFVNWRAGVVPNYGVLLEAGLDPYNHFASSEDASQEFRPKLVITYNTGYGEYVQTIQRGLEGSEVADAYIWAYLPDYNTGGSGVLYTGSYYECKKYSLLRFNWVPFGFGCTRTIGYWKTHAGFGPQADAVTPLLPITLGTAGGSTSLVVPDARTAVNVLVMKTYGSPSNGITKLYAQLLAARLNILSGAEATEVSSVLSAADAFLATHGYTDWASLSDAEKQTVLGWMTALDGYNNGLNGPAHCDDVVTPM